MSAAPEALRTAALAAAVLYLLFLAGEAILLAWARRRIRIVVHVNGTRGKTETTRLVAAAFRACGLATFAKTTGTEPRLILPDGTERRLRRAGAPNVREQRDLLLRAALHGAEALVAECMAVSPEAQAASTAFLRPSLLVVTNVRPDHADAQGSPGEALAAFAAGIPAGGAVVAGDPALLPVLEAEAAKRGARVLQAGPLEGTAARVAANAGTALAVVRWAGLDEARAVAGMRDFQADPGAFALRRLPGGTRVVDALAANDPVSAGLLLQRALPVLAEGGPRLLLYAGRTDRRDRSEAFAEWLAGHGECFDALLLAGAAGGEDRLRAAFPGLGPDGRPRLRRLTRWADLDLEPPGAVVFATGNWKGHGPELAALAPAEPWSEGG